ncbi:MAG: hypothetical protein H6830_04430 [Planctomycetes bacterium]|nr:hypothetical protein [Planctomycetota bacterium]MCB9910482.1 hypothetical protein [Planctomycetota bacterium]MCB9912608.1 hypothetical protein [Planctomycetota bacterium]HPF15028.1 hypothetical protein [Planctomycetota bacterium]
MKFSKPILWLGAALALFAASVIPLACNTPYGQGASSDLVGVRDDLGDVVQAVQNGDITLNEAGKQSVDALVRRWQDFEQRSREEANAIPGRATGALLDGLTALQTGGAGAGLIALIMGLFRPTRKEQETQIALASKTIMEERNTTRQELRTKISDLEKQLALQQKPPA